MTYNWGIIGTGSIANEMGQALNNLNKSIYGVCSGRLENAKKFAKHFQVDHIFNNYHELLEDTAIDIIYIATPHNSHFDIIKEALEHDKHVFCEKAITINAKQLQACVKIAKERNLIISDGVTLFHMPLFHELKKLISTNQLGSLKMVQVNFGSHKEYDVNNRFFSKELAGGALLDIGVYAVSFARFFMSSQPNVVLTTASYFETGVDETSGIILKNQDEEMAVIALTMRAKQPKRGVVAFENGFIEINDYPRAESATITYTNSGETKLVELGKSTSALEYEILDMESYITNQDGKENLMLISDVMDLLTSIRTQWGMVYPFE